MALLDGELDFQFTRPTLNAFTIVNRPKSEYHLDWWGEKKLAATMVHQSDPFAHEGYGSLHSRAGLYRDIRLEWFGRKHWPIKATEDFERSMAPDIPLKFVRVSKIDYSSGTVHLCRKDAGLLWIAYYRAKFALIDRAIYLKYAVFFRSLRRVGLLHCPPDRYPTIRDIGFRSKT